MHKVLDLKSWLQGSWSLERSVEDLGTLQSGKMTGQAAFSPWQKGLLYKEKAQFAFGPYQDEVGQSYLYSFSPSSCADVYFMDGRPFHVLDLSTGQQQVQHPCGPDIYSGHFKVLSPLCFYTNWRIEGPRKKIIIETRFHKIQGA